MSSAWVSPAAWGLAAMLAACSDGTAWQKSNASMGASGSGGVQAGSAAGAGGDEGAGIGAPTGGGAGGSAGGGARSGAGGVNAGSGGGAGGAGGTGGAGGMGDASDASGASGDAGMAEPPEAGQSAGCGQERTLQNGRITIQSAGMDRSYILTVPDSYDNNHPYRLILGYHWRGGDANQVATAPQGAANEKLHYGLVELADDSTIFIAPEGIDNGWANPGGRDVTFTDDILEQVEADLCIDMTRIFANGFSWGAGMSYALACARPDVVRGVLLYSGAIISGCEGGSVSAPVAYFGTHGIDDTVLGLDRGAGLRDDFAQVNGCTPQDPPQPSAGSGTHTCSSYERCSDGHPTRWCVFDGGHWPSQHDNGAAESWIPREAWKFITQF